MKRLQLTRKPKMLLLVAVLGIAGGLPGAGLAAETPSVKGYFSQLLKGNVHLAPVGQRAGLHMSFSSPSDNRDAFSAVHADRPGGSDSGIHLSVRMPWK